MKLNARDIKGFMANPLQQKGLLVYGPDHGQIRQRAEETIKAVLGESPDPFNRIEMTQEQVLEDSTRLYDELASMSFLGGVRLVFIPDATDKLTKALEPCIEQLGNDNFLLVVSDELGPRSSLRGLFEKSKDGLAALPCYKDEGAGLSRFIEDTLREQGLRLERGALMYLSAHLGGDRMIVTSELTKLALYAGEETQLGLETVQQVIGNSDERTLDMLCDAVGNGNLAALQRVLERLQLEGTSEVAVLRMVARHFSRLYQVKLRAESGEPLESALKSLRPPLFFKQEPAFKKQLSRWSADKLARGLQLLLEAEAMVKSDAAMPDLLLSRSLMRLAKAA